MGVSEKSEIKRTCFVIGPIGSAGTETRRNADFLLRGIIRPVLEDILHLEVWRADEDSRPGMITDKVINDIHDSELLVADLSELNPNAFYELGIRHAAAKASIHMASSGTKLPFDNLGHRVIFFDKQEWESIEAARRQLLEQANQALTSSFQVSNPVTQALSAKAFNASAAPTEKVIGDLMQRVERIEQSRSLIDTNVIYDTSESQRIYDIFSEVADLFSLDYSAPLMWDTALRIQKKYPLSLINNLYAKNKIAEIRQILDTEYIPF